MLRFSGPSGEPHGEEIAEGEQPCDRYPGAVLEPHGCLQGGEPPNDLVFSGSRPEELSGRAVL